MSQWLLQIREFFPYRPSILLTPFIVETLFIYVETLENLNNKIDEVQNLKDQNLQVTTENDKLKSSLKDALEKYNAQKKITEAVQSILKRKCSELSEYDKLFVELQEFQ